MNILFITPRFPFPPVKGDKLRSLCFIKELSQRHTIHLLSFTESPGGEQHIETLEKYCEKVKVVYLPRWRSILNMLANTCTKIPFQVCYFSSNKMKRLVGDALRDNSYDIVYVTLMRMAPYIKHIKGLPVLLDHIDCLSINMERRFRTEKGFMRKKLFENEYRRMKDYELMFKNVPSVVTSEKDREALGGYKCLKVITNGVDAKRFSLVSEDKVEKDIDLIFVGNMGYYPNIQAIDFFFQRIYPRLKKHKKDIKIYIVGANPKKSIKLLDNHENIFVTGFVNDVKEYLYRSKVFIGPLQSGSGIQNKLLEAMSCGVPVVATSIANSGIKAKDNKEIIIVNDPISFAKNIILLLDNKQRRMILSNEARKFVEDRFSWKRRGNELESFCHEVINKCDFQPNY